MLNIIYFQTGKFNSSPFWNWNRVLFPQSSFRNENPTFKIHFVVRKKVMPGYFFRR